MIQATHVVKSIFFDEGPTYIEPELTNPNRASGDVRANIDTKLIDGYRQGVELVLQKHYDAGVVKIHSGEKNHTIRQNRFGMDIHHREESHAFMDNEKFDPYAFISLQEKFSYLYDDIFTLPFIIGDNDEVTTKNFDGVIEPFTIRGIVGFNSIEHPFIAHSIKAGLAAGNEDTRLGTCEINQIDYFNPESNIIVYLDLGFFKNEFIRIKPFNDAAVNKLLPKNTDDVMLQALRLLNPASDNFIEKNKRSYTAGWDFDSNSSIGTDSIAFGGMTY